MTKKMTHQHTADRKRGELTDADLDTVQGGWGERGYHSYSNGRSAEFRAESNDDPETSASSTAIIGGFKCVSGMDSGTD